MPTAPMPTAPPILQAACYHCGADCPADTPPVRDGDKTFCCAGCRAVYQVLAENNLCRYYDLNQAPGRTPRLERLAFLDNHDIAAQLIDFQNEDVAHVTFQVPAIHCSSCLWLLEHLYRLAPGITQSRVDFLQKQVHLVFAPAHFSLRQVAELLTSLGYEPLVSLNDVVRQGRTHAHRPLLYRLAVAGFGAGNVMLFSFPEYLGLDDPAFRHVFGLLNLVLAAPVVFYSGSGYFTSVWNSLRRGIVNIDFPILLGILVAYFRGAYEVLALGGAGYFDSVTGLIFFLLCGKWYQQRTYDYLSFERDYKAYFPLAVQRLDGDGEQPVPVADLRPGDRIRLRHGDLVPADGLLVRGAGLLDYSFVTGEATPEPKAAGDLLYAGGRQTGGVMDMEVVRGVSQSYLTQLWNNDAFRKDRPSRLRTFADAVGGYFTFTVLVLATLVGAYWYGWADQPATAVNAFTAVLIVACPCVLSLSYPVVLGHGLRWLARRGLHLKQAGVIERMVQCDTVVFDKTGTLTGGGGEATERFAPPLSAAERAAVRAVAGQSAHPLSRRLWHCLDASPDEQLSVERFSERPGQGISGRVGELDVKLGSADFTGAGTAPGRSGVHVCIGREYRGWFGFAVPLRTGLPDMLAALAANKKLHLLSGDTAPARQEWQPWFAEDAQHFGCGPEDKLRFVAGLQAAGHRVLMVGDGLNDAGALKQADVGVAVTDDTLRFTPASDGILEARSLARLPLFLRYGRHAMRLIRFSFGVSLLYNLAGLSFAAAGHLSPVVAAVLMPLSSATMVLLGTVGMRGWRAG